jgi:hypothetical protein
MFAGGLSAGGQAAELHHAESDYPGTSDGQTKIATADPYEPLLAGIVALLEESMSGGQGH